MSNQMNTALRQALESQLAMSVMKQIMAGVPPVSPTKADELLLTVAQLPHDRIRGLIVIAAVEADTPLGKGLDVQVHCLGNQATLEPLAELGMHTMDQRLSEPTPDCDCPACQFKRAEAGPVEQGSLLHQLVEALSGLGTRGRGMF